MDRKNNVYEVVVSEEATQMLLSHIRFFSTGQRVCSSKINRIISEFRIVIITISAAESLASRSTHSLKKIPQVIIRPALPAYLSD